MTQKSDIDKYSSSYHTSGNIIVICACVILESTCGLSSNSRDRKVCNQKYSCWDVEIVFPLNFLWMILFYSLLDQTSIFNGPLNTIKKKI